MPVTPVPKTAAQRKADERARNKEAGLVPVTIWVRPGQREQLRRYVDRLQRLQAP